MEKKQILGNPKNVADLLVMDFFSFLIFYSVFKNHHVLSMQLSQYPVPSNIVKIDEEKIHATVASIKLGLDGLLINLSVARKMLSLLKQMKLGMLEISKDDIVDLLKKSRINSSKLSPKVGKALNDYLATPQGEVEFLQDIFKISMTYTGTTSIYNLLKRVDIKNATPEDASTPQKLDMYDIQELNGKLKMAFKKKNLKDFKSLLKQGADPNTDGSKFAESMLEEVIRKDMTEFLKALIDAGADIKDKNLLHQAIRDSYDIDILKTLIEAGVDVNERYKSSPYQGETPFFYAIDMFSHGSDISYAKDIIKLLVKAGADTTLNCNGQSFLDIKDSNGIVEFAREEVLKDGSQKSKDAILKALGNITDKKPSSSKRKM